MPLLRGWSYCRTGRGAFADAAEDRRKSVRPMRVARVPQKRCGGARQQRKKPRDKTNNREQRSAATTQDCAQRQRDCNADQRMDRQTKCSGGAEPDPRPECMPIDSGLLECFHREQHACLKKKYDWQQPGDRPAAKHRRRFDEPARTNRRRRQSAPDLEDHPQQCAKAAHQKYGSDVDHRPIGEVTAAENSGIGKRLDDRIGQGCSDECGGDAEQRWNGQAGKTHLARLAAVSEFSL